MLNNIILMGRLGADPELRKTQSGVSVTAFQIATNRTYNRELTDWFTIVAWREKAEFITKHFAKGSMIIVEGCLETRSYEDKQGNRRTVVEIRAEQVHFAGVPKSENKDRKPEPQPTPAPQKQSVQQGFAGDGLIYGQGISIGDMAEYEEVDTSEGDLPF